jgi:hypothetical protein
VHNQPLTIVSIYIDNCQIIGLCTNIDKIKHQLTTKIPIKDVRPASSILSIEVLHNPGSHASFNLHIPVSYCNTDWGANKINCKSDSSYVFIIMGGPIMWAAHSQSTIALLSTEAELTSLSEATKQALYLKHLLGQLKITIIQLHNNIRVPYTLQLSQFTCSMQE